MLSYVKLRQIKLIFPQQQLSNLSAFFERNIVARRRRASFYYKWKISLNCGLASARKFAPLTPKIAHISCTPPAARSPRRNCSSSLSIKPINGKQSNKSTCFSNSNTPNNCNHAGGFRSSITNRPRYRYILPLIFPPPSPRMTSSPF